MQLFFLSFFLIYIQYYNLDRCVKLFNDRILYQNMTNFFVSHTPYHVIINYSIIHSEFENEKNIHIIISDFNNSKLLFDDLVTLDQKTIYFHLKGRYPKNNQTNYKLIWPIRDNLKKIKSIYHKHSDLTNRVYSNNDHNQEGQYLQYLNDNKKYNYSVEDGMDFYDSWINTTPFYFKYNILPKLIFGFWYNRLPFPGLSPYSYKLKVLFPKIVRSELKNTKIIEAINLSHLHTNKTHELSNFFTNKIELNTKSDMTILIMPHSEEIKKFSIDRNTLISRINDLIIDFSKTTQIYLKYHPRESNKELIFINNGQFTEIPNSLPIEIFYIKNKENIRNVVGYISTSLLTARAFLGTNINIFSFFNSNKNHFDPRIISIFNHLEINLI